MQFDYKVKNGKLLRILADIDSGFINDVKIRGDFFMHPEDFLNKLEDFFVKKNVMDINPELLDKFFLDNKVEIYGFSSIDLVYCLNKINDNL